MSDPSDDDLLIEVRDALQARKGRWRQIAAEIPDVSYTWLCAIGNGTYASAPSYKRLKAVASHLRAEKQAAAA